MWQVQKFFLFSVGIMIYIVMMLKLFFKIFVENVNNIADLQFSFFCGSLIYCHLWKKPKVRIRHVGSSNQIKCEGKGLSYAPK